MGRRPAVLVLVVLGLLAIGFLVWQSADEVQKPEERATRPDPHSLSERRRPTPTRPPAPTSTPAGQDDPIDEDEDVDVLARVARLPPVEDPPPLALIAVYQAARQRTAARYDEVAVACGPDPAWANVLGDGSVRSAAGIVFANEAPGGVVFRGSGNEGVGVLRGDGSRWVELSWDDEACTLVEHPTARVRVDVGYQRGPDVTLVRVVVDGIPVSLVEPGQDGIDAYYPTGRHSLQLEVHRRWEVTRGPPVEVVVVEGAEVQVIPPD